MSFQGQTGIRKLERILEFPFPYFSHMSILGEKVGLPITTTEVVIKK